MTHEFVGLLAVAVCCPEVWSGRATGSYHIACIQRGRGISGVDRFSKEAASATKTLDIQGMGSSLLGIMPT